MTLRHEKSTGCSVPGQSRTHMIYVAPEVRWMVTSNMGSATMTFIDRTSTGGGGRGGPGGPPAPGGPPPAGGGPPPSGGGRGPGGQADWDETVVPVGRGAEGFDVSPDGKEVWAANAQDGTISVIDVATKRVTQTLAANVTGANRLKFTPDGKLVFVSTLSGPDVTVLDAATRKEVKRIPVGHGAAGIEMQPDGARVYVACTPDDYVVVIDVKTLAVTGPHRRRQAAGRTRVGGSAVRSLSAVAPGRSARAARARSRRRSTPLRDRQ